MRNRLLWGAALLLLLFAAHAGADESSVDPSQMAVPPEMPQVEVPVPGQGKRSIIPVPEVITSPTEGVTGGMLGVVLFAKPDKSIHSIFAPDVRWNEITGFWPTLRYLGFPDPQQKFLLIGGKATKRGDFFEGEYSGEDLFAGALDLYGNARRDQDPFERFFGFGNDSEDDDETNYTGTVHRLILSLGYNLAPRIQTSLQARWNHVRVGRGGVNSVENLRSSRFAAVKGVDGASIVAARFGITYDSRDDSNIPTEGLFAAASFEIADKVIGSTHGFQRYGLEGKGFFPLRRDRRVIFALHGAIDYMGNGTSAPFYERNTVGGIHSLRGYGRNRFTDLHRVVLQGELRNTVFQYDLFGVRANIEVSPFVDLAKVFHNGDEFPLERLHPVGGVGFRGVVVPQVVAYVDVGTSGDSAAVFTGIDYPF
ncbi:MAG TPA: BamA/TamA family outer membrane protein [Terriglobales bacterium]|nr:BamA/TamA family outer membrane protein [Terriglobales bacterium]